MEEEKVVSGGFAEDLGDVPGSLVVLAIALFFLCFALYWIVRILHYLVLASGRRTDENGEPTPFIRITQKVLGMNPVLSIICGFTSISLRLFSKSLLRVDDIISSRSEV